MTNDVVEMEAEKLRRVISVLAAADSAMDKVLDTLPSDHPLYGDLASVGNWVRAVHRRLEEIQ
jgi:hypothetical protein